MNAQDVLLRRAIRKRLEVAKKGQGRGGEGTKSRYGWNKQTKNCCASRVMFREKCTRDLRRVDQWYCAALCRDAAVLCCVVS